MSSDLELLEKRLHTWAEKKPNMSPYACPCNETSYTYSQGFEDGMIGFSKFVLKEFFTKEKDPAQLELPFPPNCS